MKGFRGQGIKERQERVQDIVDTEWKKDSIRRILKALSRRLFQVSIDEAYKKMFDEDRRKEEAFRRLFYRRP